MALILNIPVAAKQVPVEPGPATSKEATLNLQIAQPSAVIQPIIQAAVQDIKQSVASEVTSNNNSQSSQGNNNGGNSDTNTSNNNIQHQNDNIGQGQQSLASPAICERLESMAAALKQANPDITNDLHFIHRAVLEDPSQVTMLTEEQKIVFFAGLKQKTGAEIIATTAKTKQASSKKLATLSVDDLL